MSKMLTARQAAEELGISEKTIRDWIFRGRNLAVTRCGRAVRIRREELERFVAENTVAPIR